MFVSVLAPTVTKDVPGNVAFNAVALVAGIAVVLNTRYCEAVKDLCHTNQSATALVDLIMMNAGVAPVDSVVDGITFGSPRP